MPSARIVRPEILDHLPPDSPEARRCRRDLRLIHALMVSERWAVKAAIAHAVPGGRIVELGAGDGHLCAALAERGFSVTGCDRIPRPRGLPERVVWEAGDIRETLPGLRGDVAVAVLFLHHFEATALAAIGRCLRNAFDTLLFCEPHRHPLALAEGALLLPFVSRATRHDMMVSLRAGFRPGEMPELLGLRAGEWEWQETTTLLGAIRMIARRKAR